MQALPIHAAAPGGETLKGSWTSREALLVGVRFDRASRLWETRVSRQRLGAWASSEEEPKPMRGSREQINLFLGGLERENPEAQPETVKSVRGAPKR